jgi:hypothetical protein|nr:MAG: Mind bomb SH3 repeat domain [Bacteriophage sp.]
MKVGQKYKVRSWDDMEREFGITKVLTETYIPCKGDFMLSMKKYCGTIVTVSSIGRHNLFRVQEDEGKYIWSMSMVKPTGGLYEAIQSRRHSSDSSMG